MQEHRREHVSLLHRAPGIVSAITGSRYHARGARGTTVKDGTEDTTGGKAAGPSCSQSHGDVPQ